MDINVAVASGLNNAKELLDEVKEGKANYHFIEIMGCRWLRKWWWPTSAALKRIKYY